MLENFKSDTYTFSMLATRCIKVFLKDKMNVFFALMAPLIVVLLYLAFLAELQIDTVDAILRGSLAGMGQGLGHVGEALDTFVNEGMADFARSDMKALVSNWMVAGVTTVSIITVSLAANSVMIADKTKGILADSLSSPVKGGVIRLSYFAFNFIVTIIIASCFLAVCMIYLAVTGAFFMSAGEFFSVIGVVLLSTLSATTITMLICGFIKSEGGFAGLSAVLGAAVGFLVGAYMPLSIMPEFAQGISAMIPGTHSGGLFRDLLMSGALENLTAGMTPDMASGVTAGLT